MGLDQPRYFQHLSKLVSTLYFWPCGQKYNSTGIGLGRGGLEGCYAPPTSVGHALPLRAAEGGHHKLLAWLGEGTVEGLLAGGIELERAPSGAAEGACLQGLLEELKTHFLFLLRP